MGKVIGFLNQKGGVGKSTLCTFISMSIYHGLNPAKSSNFAAIYDIDSPQHSLHHWREIEVSKLKVHEEANNTYYDGRLSKIYSNEFKPINVYKSDILGFKKNIQSFKDTFEYTFVDVVGTVNTDGYDEEFLSLFDVFLIPTSFSQESVRATMVYVSNIIFPFAHKHNKKFSLIFTDVLSSQLNQCQSLINELRSQNYVVCDNIITSREKYVSLYLLTNSGRLSTLFPITDQTIDQLAIEIKNM